MVSNVENEVLTHDGQANEAEISPGLSLDSCGEGYDMAGWVGKAGSWKRDKTHFGSDIGRVCIKRIGIAELKEVN